MKIEGGLKSGSNLFHSFEEFSIPEGMEASFENSLEIENIFTRVTGDSASTINGTLSAQGGANLFLMNPNGIVFGQDASINIGGSFIATTADSVQFADSTEFAATSTEDPTPLLTNEIPIGLGFGSDSNSGPITVNGEGNQIGSEDVSEPTEIETSFNGLQVDSGEKLILIGDNVNLNGGIVISEGGTIEIGSVQNGFVGITEDLETNYDNVDSFGTVQLEDQSLINATNTSEGAITINSADLFLNDGSKILLQNNNDTPSGDIDINVSDSVVLDGKGLSNKVGSGIQAQTTGSGQAGNINLNTQTVVLKDGSRISSNTYSDGLGGNIAINASDSIEIIEDTQNLINASTYDSGNAGSVNLSTNDLIITDGGGVSSSTLGAGQGGNLNVEAKNVEIIGDLSEPDDLSAISAVSFSPDGDAGTITVNTDTLKIADGGAVSTTSLGDGAAGNITVNASDSIEIIGQTESFPSTISSSVIDRAEALGITNPNGSAGSVEVNTSSLSIAQGGEVTVGNEGTGSSGTLSINADEVNLDDNGSITAASASGQGGNIELQVSKL